MHIWRVQEFRNLKTTIPRYFRNFLVNFAVESHIISRERKFWGDYMHRWENVKNYRDTNFIVHFPTVEKYLNLWNCVHVWRLGRRKCSIFGCTD